METTKIISLTIVGIVYTSISITITQFFLRKEKVKSGIDENQNISFVILFATWILGFSILNIKSINILSEFLDLIEINGFDSNFYLFVRTTSLFLGLSLVWFSIASFVTNLFLSLVISKRKLLLEMESNNIAYFLLKSVVFFGFLLILLVPYELLLRVFLPIIEMPFYR